jgi:probable HAF family extracellular repeat protein
MLGTFANGINDAGQIVGSYVDYFGGLPQPRGFLYSGGAFTTINDPLAGFGQKGGTYANGINDAGQIVGSYTDEGLMSHGFLYSGGTFTTIDDPLAGLRGFVGGTGVSGINDAGQIVGNYTNASGYYGFVATPTALSEPSTFTMAVAAFLGIAGLRTRKWLRS